MQLMKYAGENGIAAYGVVMYVNFIFQAIFMGYSVGSAPIVGFNYGSGNKKELKSYMAHRMSSGLDCLIQLTTKKCISWNRAKKRKLYTVIL